MTDKEQEEIFALETQAAFIDITRNEIAQVIEHLNTALNNPEANMTRIKKRCKYMLEKLQIAHDSALMKVFELQREVEAIKNGTN